MPEATARTDAPVTGRSLVGATDLMGTDGRFHAVNPAMVHGGPFPAASAPATTSVGARAIDRFPRPVVYQDVPAERLPCEPRDDNPYGIVRRRNGMPEPDRKGHRA